MALALLLMKGFLNQFETVSRQNTNFFNLWKPSLGYWLYIQEAKKNIVVNSLQYLLTFITEIVIWSQLIGNTRISFLKSWHIFFHLLKALSWETCGGSWMMQKWEDGFAFLPSLSLSIHTTWAASTCKSAAQLHIHFRLEGLEKNLDSYPI